MTVLGTGRFTDPRAALSDCSELTSALGCCHSGRVPASVPASFFMCERPPNCPCSCELRCFSRHSSTASCTSMGIPPSKPVSLARLFSVLKLVYSLYTKKDHVLLAYVPGVSWDGSCAAMGGGVPKWHAHATARTLCSVRALKLPSLCIATTADP